MGKGHAWEGRAGPSEKSWCKMMHMDFTLPHGTLTSAYSIKQDCQSPVHLEGHLQGTDTANCQGYTVGHKQNTGEKWKSSEQASEKLSTLHKKEGEGEIWEQT